MSLQVGTKSDFDEILSRNNRVVVIFYASWVGPCKMIKPKFEAFADEFKAIKFITVDVDENSETAEAYDISSEVLPTFKFFQNGKAVLKLLGASENELKKKLQELDNLQITYLPSSVKRSCLQVLGKRA